MISIMCLEKTRLYKIQYFWKIDKIYIYELYLMILSSVLSEYERSGGFRNHNPCIATVPSAISIYLLRHSVNDTFFTRK